MFEILDEVVGAAAGLVVGDTVRKVTRDTGHAVMGSRRGEDEATDLLMDGVGLAAGIATGMAVFDLFDGEE